MISVVDFSRRRSFSIKPPKSILISNNAGIGDAVLSTSVIPVLKSAFPEVEIGFLVGSGSKSVLEGHPLVKRVHIVDHFYYNRKDKSLFRRILNYWCTSIIALIKIRATSYDVAIELNPHMQNSIILLWMAGIPARLGYTSGGFGALLTHKMDWVDKPQHFYHYYMDLLRFLPVEKEHISKAHVTLPSLGEDEFARELECIGVQNKKYIVFHVGPSAVWKKWQTENWRELAKLLVADGMKLIFTGSTSIEKSEVATITEGLEGCANLCGRLNWAGFVSAIKYARLLVSIDTCAYHVASGFNTPCILLTMGVAPHQWYPMHMPAKVLTHSVDCIPCYRRGGCEGMECLKGISVSRVYKAVNEILQCSTKEMNQLPFMAKVHKPDFSVT
jgi:ADP-heptose:LPS heptosyltransferase